MSTAERNNEARRVLRRLGSRLLAHSHDPEADPATLAEQARQTGELVLAELAEAAPAPHEPRNRAGRR